MQTQSSLQPECTKRSIARRCLRYGVLSVAVIVLLALAGLWIVTRSWFIVGRIQPELERRLGGEVSVAHAEFDFDGGFIIEGVIVRSRDHTGTAGEIARVERAEVSVDIADLFAGKVNVLAIDLHHTLLRISEDAEQANRYSFDSLQADWSDADPARTRPPRIELHDVTIEYGTHTGADYRMLGRRYVSGIMHPAAADAAEGHWYNFVLGERGPTGGPSADGITIRGQWNAESHRYIARMDGLDLNESTYNMCPQVVRAWWDHMDLDGRIAHAIVQWDPASGLSVTSEIFDVGLTLPIQPGAWARYSEGRIIGDSGRQRMRVQSGTIRLEDDELVLDTLVGELAGADGTAGVPYTVTMRLQLPHMNWKHIGGRDALMAYVRDFAPFEVQFALAGFRLEADEQGRAAAVDLPLPVAGMLERFSITDWTISTNIKISRDAAETDSSDQRQIQPIAIEGDLAIDDASGSFDKFPYPLAGVDAYLTFTQDHVDVHHVTGTAPSGADVRITGEIAPLGPDPRIDLRLVATDAPIDDLTRAALPEVHAAVFDGLLHEPSQQQLRDAGLLIDEQRLLALQVRRDELKAQAAHQPLDEAASVELARVEAMIEAGIFDLGGVVDLDVNIHRDFGPDEKTQLSGEIRIHRLDAIIRYFPYPFSIRGGTIRWGPDGAALVADGHEPGLPVITQTGGRGHISGSFLREIVEDGPDKITPDVHIQVAGDVVSDLIYTSIPGQRDSKRIEELGGLQLSQSARLLREISLDGPMSYHGSVRRDANDKIRYDFTVELANGTAEPTQDLAEALGSAGLVWPADWLWHDVNVKVRVSPEAVELAEMTGRRDGGRVAASGVLDVRTRGADASLDVKFSDLQLDRYLIDLVPVDSRPRAVELWDTYQPEGTFNAHLQFHKRRDVTLPPRLFLEPASIAATVDGQRVSLTHVDGRLAAHESAVDFDDLQLDLHRGEVSDGRLSLDGRYTASQAGSGLAIQGRWSDGRFESPIINELLGLFGASEHNARLRAFDPAGVFSADFRYGTGDEDDDARDFELIVRPRTLAANLQDRRLHLQLSDQSIVRLTPGLVELLDVHGAHESGTFQLAGKVRLNGGLEATLHFDHVGSLTGDLPQALLPLEAQRAMTRVGYTDGPATRIANARLRLAQDEVATGDEPMPWHVDFQGTVQTDRASLNADVKVSEIDGQFDVLVQMKPEQIPVVSIDADIKRLRVFDRYLTSIIAPQMELSDDGLTFSLPEIRGDAYGGAVWADASIGVGENLAYAANVNFVGVSLDRLLTGAHEARLASTRSRGPRGDLFGAFQISGMRGRPETRSGRGSARAIGNGLADVPLVLQMVQIVQLTFPLRGDMDHADLVFYIDGDRAVFERILLESTVGNAAALQLIGNGEMNLRSFEMDTQFRSRSGMLVIRDLVGGLSDQLYVIEVTGTPANPRARIVPLPGLTQPDRQPLNAAVLVDPTR